MISGLTVSRIILGTILIVCAGALFALGFTGGMTAQSSICRGEAITSNVNGTVRWYLTDSSSCLTNVRGYLSFLTVLFSCLTVTILYFTMIRLSGYQIKGKIIYPRDPLLVSQVPRELPDSHP